MKRVIAFSCAALLASAAMAQSAPRDQDHSHSHQHSQQQDRSSSHRHDDSRAQDREGNHWQRGHQVTAHYRSTRYVVTDYNRYHLRQPPRGYHWVRADNDYVLAAVTTGLIASIIAGSH